MSDYVISQVKVEKAENVDLTEVLKANSGSTDPQAASQVSEDRSREQGRRNRGPEGPWPPLFSKLCKRAPLKPKIGVVMCTF